MSSDQLEPDVLEWVREGLSLQREPCLMRDMLRGRGYSTAAIQHALGDLYPDDRLRFTACKDYPAFASVRLTRAKKNRAVKRINTTQLQAYVIDDFLTTDECEQLIAISRKRVEPSVLASGQTSQHRTSSTCYLAASDGDIVTEIDKKMAKTLGIRLGFSESIQAQIYEQEQHFAAHTDYFDQATMQQARETLLHPGQRTWTFMVYLNEPERGGHTKFHALKKSIRPRQARAVVWNNLNADGTPNPNTVHEGLAVEAGYKAIITKWFRDEGTGEPFYG